MSKHARAKILVPVDFTPCSDAALDWALSKADESGAEVELLHVWCPCEAVIFADTPRGIAMEERLLAAESVHGATRVCGRLELGDEPSLAILRVVAGEHFDMIVIGKSGRVATRLLEGAPCAVITLPSSAPPHPRIARTG